MISGESLPSATKIESPLPGQINLAPLEGNLRIFVDFFPGVLVISTRLIGFNHWVIMSCLDITENKLISMEMIDELLLLGQPYQAQIEAQNGELILANQQLIVDFIEARGQLVFLRLTWNQLPNELAGILEKHNNTIQPI